jgi:putative methyltransferase (TIGR04325 family)
MEFKDFLPPILIKLAKRLKNIEEYQDYAQAMQVCTQEAYQNIELCNMIADKTIIHASKLKEKPFNLNPTNVFLLSAINQYINIYAKKDLTILDFGGACGAHYYEMIRFIPKNISLKWIVVETEQMVKSATDKGLVNDELNFISSLKDINTKIDFIHSSCTLHYVPNPYEILNKLINLNANWIFFNRMMFNSKDRDFITVQKSLISSNGPGNLPEGYTDRKISYPHNTLSFQKFNLTFINNYYENEWTFEELSGSYQIGNEKIDGKGLLYIRK